MARRRQHCGTDHSTHSTAHSIAGMSTDLGQANSDEVLKKIAVAMKERRRKRTSYQTGRNERMMRWMSRKVKRRKGEVGNV